MEKSHIEEIVNRADLYIDGTVKRSEGGLPIGNGKMGTLVWTSPSAIKTQINRVDVFSNDSTSNSFNDRHLDYGYGCAFVDVDFAGFGVDVFTDQARQHLDLYHAYGKITGENVEVGFFACEGLDVFVFDICDKRAYEHPVNLRLKMLRMPEVRQKSQLAISSFHRVRDVIVLKQVFTEGNFYCASAVAVLVSGRENKVRYSNEDNGLTQGIPGRKIPVLGSATETEMRLYLRPGPGNYCLYVSSAASFDKNEDVVMKAEDFVTKAAAMGRKQLKTIQEEVWRNYWSKSYIELWGTPEAQLVETHYQYFYYIMGCCSRNGKYPPNYGGMLFLTRGDPRLWGAMQWWNNLSLYYNPVMASGRYELVMPYFNQWNLMSDRLRTYARQQWDSEGLFIPETIGFDGPEVLPESIAKEMSDLMLGRKPWNEKSEEFIKLAMKKRPHEARWNFVNLKTWKDGELVCDDRGLYAAVTHMMGSQVGIANTYWEYYLFTGNRTYFEQYGYPIISGIAEFFRTYPNVKLDADGKYHIYGTNSSEGYWGSKDSMESMLAMHVIFPMAIKASQELGIDDDKRILWKELYDKLAPLPASDHPDLLDDTLVKDPPIWVNAVGTYTGTQKQVIASQHVCPIRLGDFCTLETRYTDPKLFEMAEHWLKTILSLYEPTSRQFVSEMSSMAKVYANMGYTEQFEQVVINQLNCINASLEYCDFNENGRVPVFENRLTSREGVNAMSAQRLGNAASGIQSALLQSGGGTITADAVLWLFPVLPAEWNARFKLHAKNGFVVEAECVEGKVGEIAVTSLLGRTLRIRKPWDDRAKVSINGSNFQIVQDDLLTFKTCVGDKFVLKRA